MKHTSHISVAGPIIALICLLIISFQSFSYTSSFEVILGPLENDTDLEELENEILNDTITREDVFIVFVIPVIPSGFARRQEIRASWANASRWHDLQNYTTEDDYYRKFKVMFVVADQVTVRN